MENKNVNVMVEENFIGMDACFIEADTNHEASDYIHDNYSTILKQTRKMQGVAFDKAEDLLMDVFVSIREAELNGLGYNSEEHSNDGDIITVAEFVYGRIKGYSRNKKYSNGVEVHHSTDGDIVTGSASSLDGEDLEEMDGFQKAMSVASTEDDLEAIELEVSLRESIEYILSFDELVGFSLLSFFKNRKSIANMEYNSSVFDKLASVANMHPDFKEAFYDAMNFANKNSDAFDAVIKTF